MMRKPYTIFIFLLTLFSAARLLGKEGEVTVTPSLNFPPTAVGVKSAPQAITITNTSAIADPDKPETYRLEGIRFENNAADFNVTTSFSPNPEFSPGQSKDIVIEFAPKSVGNKNTRVWIHYYKVGDSPNDFDSIAVYIAAEATPAPLAKFDILNTPVVFKKVLKPGEDTTETFIIKNNGNASGTITAIDFIKQPNPDFTITDFTSPVSIDAGKQRTFTIRFTAKLPSDDDKVNQVRITTSVGQLSPFEVRGRVGNFPPPPEAKLRFFKKPTPGNATEDVTFGNLPPGANRVEDFFLKNTGGQPVQIIKVEFFKENTQDRAFITDLKPLPASTLR